jgi:outer membrane protein assembly factor BamD (BamD/ComL family)
MKFSTATMTVVALVATVLFGYAFTGFSSIEAQNVSTPNNMTSLTNMTDSNMTASDTSGSSARMLLQEGIKALKIGDSQAAMTNLDAAKQAMVPGEAMNHFEQGMKALENGDLNGAIMHLTAADQALLKT